MLMGELVPGRNYIYKAPDKLGSRGKCSECRFLGRVSVEGNPTMMQTCLIRTSDGEQKLVSPDSITGELYEQSSSQ